MLKRIPKRVLILIPLLILIIGFFWVGSRYASLDQKAAGAGIAVFGDKLSFVAKVEMPENASQLMQILVSTTNWMYTNAIGMTFGVALAIVALLIVSYLPIKANSRWSSGVKGLLLGAPLGVCVNCASPIALGMIKGGSNKQMSLGMMLASPSLNIIIISMLFGIFPFYMAMVKVLLSVLFIILIVPFISSFTKKQVRRGNFAKESWSAAIQGLLHDAPKAVFYIFTRTVPLMVIAGLLGVVLTYLIPLEMLINLQPKMGVMLLVAFIGTFLPVPIALDIVIVHALYAAGLHPALAAILLLTLSMYSIYAYGIVAKGFSWKIATLCFVLIMALGIIAGVATQAIAENQWVSAVSRYHPTRESTDAPLDPQAVIVNTQAVRKETVLSQEHIRIQAFPHNQRKNKELSLFTFIRGEEIGLTPVWNLDILDWAPPFGWGHGIASGDYNNDGWVDILIGAENGAYIFTNDGKGSFGREFITALKDKNVFLVAFVDFNNDQLLDIYATTYEQGNFIILNEGRFTASRIIHIPSDARLTAAAAFADIDNDGDLDIIDGNWFQGAPRGNTHATSRNMLHLNNDLRFTTSEMPGPPGETLSVLVSDITHSGTANIVIGNDFEQGDVAFEGLDKNINRKLSISSRATMSIDSADINNDLLLDIYFVGISNTFEASKRSSWSIDALNELNQEEKTYYNNLITAFDNARTRNFAGCRTHPNEQDCLTLTLFRSITWGKSRNASLCETLASDRYQKLCQSYFLPKLAIGRGIRSGAGNYLHLNTGSGFTEVGESYQIRDVGWGWNAKFADVNNDGFQDLFAVNGRSERIGGDKTQATNAFFINRNGSKFELMPHTAASLLRTSSYTYIDIDNDGDLDMVVPSSLGIIQVYLNNEHRNHAITLELHDTTGNYYSIGSKVIVRTKTSQFLRELKASGGFMSFDSPRLHIGIGDAKSVEKITIRWPDGKETIINQSLPADYHYTIERSKL